MDVTFTRTFTVDAPDGATHYTGNLLHAIDHPDAVTWYKYAENSTGTVRAWHYYKQGVWLFLGGQLPRFIHVIPPQP